jgi:L-fuculose-phosphate aldolase
MSDYTPQQEMALLCRILGRQGYQDKITGHITIAQGGGETLWVSPVDRFWHEVRARDVIRIDDSGTVLEGGGKLNPTALSHFALHRRRPDAHVVIHNHPPYGTIWSAKCELPPLLDQSSANGGGKAALCSEYDGVLSSTDRFDRLALAYGDADMAILANHGTMVSGEDVPLALVRALSFEWRCRKAYEVSCTGSKGVELSEEVAKELGTYASEYGVVLFDAYGRIEIDLDPAVLL